MIGGGFGPNQFDALTFGKLALCSMTSCEASAAAAAIVTKISGRGTLAQRSARERLAPVRLRH